MKLSTDLGSERLRINFYAAICFACGASTPYFVNLIGQLYMVELFLLPIGIGVLFTCRGVLKNRVLLWFLVAAFLMIVGYFLTDLIRGTAQALYIRAFARVLFLLLDFAILALIILRDRRGFWWFCLGIALGGFAFHLVAGTSIHVWKFGYGQSFILLTACLAYWFPRHLITLAFIALGVISLYFDSRVQGALCFGVAGIWGIRALGFYRPHASFSTFVVLGLVGSVVAAGLFYALSVTEQDFGERRQASNIMRITALKVGVHAILKSPLIGYGSWGEGTKEFAQEAHREMASELKELDIHIRRGSVLITHSQILQGWMEAGFLAAIFFLMYGYRLIEGLFYLTIKRPIDYLLPLYAYVLTSGLWHLFMSPFNGAHRLQIAMAIAVLCALYAERKTSVQPRSEPTPRKPLFEPPSLVRTTPTSPSTQ